jgi:hypothetical protein
MKRPKKNMPLKARNPVARSPLLAKGGQHGKTNGAQRRRARTQLARALRDPAALDPQ